MEMVHESSEAAVPVAPSPSAPTRIGTSHFRLTMLRKPGS